MAKSRSRAADDEQGLRVKISRISLFELALPLDEPYLLSRGRTFSEFESTFVKVETDEGITGWGEICPWGATYLPAFGGGVRAALAEISPHLLGHDPRETEKVNRLMDAVLSGHVYAKAGIDYALWDIAGKAAGQPVSALLGGAETDAVPIVSSVHIDTPENMAADVQRWRDLGYRRHSIKVGESIDGDIARIEHLADLRLPGEVFDYDANGGWSAWEAVQVMRAVRHTDAWFEQPCLTYEESLAVRRQTDQALSLDECMTGVREVVRAIQDNACEAINIKLARVGGITRARWIRDLCLEFGIPMLVMDMAGTVVNDSVVAHFASTIPAERCIGTWSCQDMVAVDPAPGRGARNLRGDLTVPEEPGLGVEPDEHILGSPFLIVA